MRMPCSSKNMCPTADGSRVERRWTLIYDALDPGGGGGGGRRTNASVAGSSDEAIGGGGSSSNVVPPPPPPPFMIVSSYDLEEAVIHYNPHYADKWNFRTLHSYFHSSELSQAETKDFFQRLLPKMVRLCLSLPEVVTSPPPLLRKLGEEGSCEREGEYRREGEGQYGYGSRCYMARLSRSFSCCRL